MNSAAGAQGQEAATEGPSDEASFKVAALAVPFLLRWTGGFHRWQDKPQPESLAGAAIFEME